MTRARISTRPGFTLVELMVVVVLIIILLGLAAAVTTSGITDSYKTTGAADRVSGWLLISKSKAQREKRPFGVRFLVGSNNLIKEAQYIEVPDSYTPLPNVTANGTILPRLNFVPAQSGPPAAAPTLYISDLNPTAVADLISSVFPGDLISIPEFNLLLTISQPLTQSGPPTAPIVTVPVRTPQLLPSNIPAGTTATYATTAFGFHRQALPAIGEPNLQVTGDMAIDVGSGMSSIGIVNGQFDVLFAPNGEVMNASGGKIVLWVRNTQFPTPRPNGAAGPDNRTDYEAAGQMAFIVVYTKTGAIATQPVALPTSNGIAGFNPFTTTQDAVNTGL